MFRSKKPINFFGIMLCEAVRLLPILPVDQTRHLRFGPPNFIGWGSNLANML
jgi:hypothetical protein